ncbi:MAG: DUF3332 domain-containing protein [Spirochaetia bacterium]|nr:DUF3332 domain-containing protein [Spirochaetia bacterium]
MKSRLKIISFFLAFTAISTISMNCYGRFVLTNKIYNWNGTAGDKFINSAVFWALLVTQIYSGCATIDFLFLNTIEFWTGKNPLAMGPGDSETKIVKKDGQELEVTATKGRLHVKVLTGKKAGTQSVLIFSPEEEAWYMQTNNGKMKIVELSQDDKTVMKLNHPDGISVFVKL